MTQSKYTETDIVIVGAGPIGIELAALLKRAGADYVHLEARQIGHTIAQWPREAQFFSAPERVALAGVPVHSPNQQSLTGELYLGYLRSLVELLDLSIRAYEPVKQIQRLEDEGFLVTTAPRTGEEQYRCRRLVLATGNLSEPRRLGIPGEEMAHVDHVLTDPHKYFKQRLLVIGGRNSALEAALRCWRAGAQVALSYRRDEFKPSVVKPFLAREVSLLIDKGKIDFYPSTTPIKIDARYAYLEDVEDNTSHRKVPIDFVLFGIGFTMDMSLLEQAGVELEGEDQVPVFDERTMETNVPNLYIAGTAAGGMEKRHELFIVTSHEHAEKIAYALTGYETDQIGSPAQRRYEVTLEEVQED